MRYFHARKIFTGDEWLHDHIIACEDGSITEVIDAAGFPSQLTETSFEILAPAFIDLQIYGAHGKLLAVFPEPETLGHTYRYCVGGGATNFLPTLATNSKEIFYRGIDAVRTYWSQGGKGVLGLHLEGPWINPAKRGAHVESLIHPPDENEVRELLQYGQGVIRMITLAPEVCSPGVLRILADSGITLSAGHSNATLEESVASFRNGITTVTHLYNAMSPLHHREPGLVGAALLDQEVYGSVIPDGHHVDFAAVRIAKEIMKERLFAITDAVTETIEGYYQHQLRGDKYECNGVLSGSALTMHQCFINLVEKAGISTGEALRMCSLYPAKVINADDLYGKITPGYQAQFVSLNKQLEMSSVISG